MKIKHVDHVGIVVQDLHAAEEFFADLGFVSEGAMSVQGQWVGNVVGIPGARETIVMMHAPDGQLSLELTRFDQLEDPDGVQQHAANTLGLRHLAFVVDDIEEAIALLRQKGRELVGKLQTYENSWKLCYVRGPEGIIVELAQQL